jgi:ATP-binding cassette subfamily C protein
VVSGVKELKAARRDFTGLILATVLFSVVVNFLMLTGPLYMLQVYDRVLSSGSEATLVALSALVIVLFLAMGVLEYARRKVMAIVGARFQEQLDRRVFAAAMQRSSSVPNDPAAITAQRDLEAIRTFLGSPVLLALMDLPCDRLYRLHHLGRLQCLGPAYRRRLCQWRDRGLYLQPRSRLADLDRRHASRRGHGLPRGL